MTAQNAETDKPAGRPELQPPRMASAISVRLYEQALKVFGMDDTSMLVISVGAEGPHVNINYAERRAVR